MGIREILGPADKPQTASMFGSSEHDSEFLATTGLSDAKDQAARRRSDFDQAATSYVHQMKASGRSRIFDQSEGGNRENTDASPARNTQFDQVHKLPEAKA